MKTYRLRLVRYDRPQTKMVTISCESEHAARCRVSARFGREWRVVSTQLAHFV